MWKLPGVQGNVGFHIKKEPSPEKKNSLISTEHALCSLNLKAGESKLKKEKETRKWGNNREWGKLLEIWGQKLRRGGFREGFYLESMLDHRVSSLNCNS